MSLSCSPWAVRVHGPWDAASRHVPSGASSAARSRQSATPPAPPPARPVRPPALRRAGGGVVPAAAEFRQVLRPAQRPRRGGAHGGDLVPQHAAIGQAQRHRLRHQRVLVRAAVRRHAHPRGQGMGRRVLQRRSAAELVERDAALQQRLGDDEGHAEPGVVRAGGGQVGPVHQAVDQRRCGDDDLRHLLRREAVRPPQRQHALRPAMRGAAGGVGLVREFGDQPARAEALQQVAEVEIVVLEQAEVAVPAR